MDAVEVVAGARERPARLAGPLRGEGGGAGEGGEQQC